MSSCPSIIRFCRSRVTRLDPATGAVVGTSNNVYVTRGGVSLALSAEITAGTESENKNGCGEVLATDRTDDTFKRWNLVFTSGKFEPGLFEMMTGATIITTGGDLTGIIGADETADDFVAPAVAFEGWSDTRLGDAPDPDYPYYYLLLVSTRWRIGDHTLGQDFTNVPLNGFSQGNNAWGTGPHDDTGLVDTVTTWAFNMTASIPPAAACGYSTIAAGS